MIRRSPALAVAALVAVVGLAACGSDDADTRAETQGLPDLQVDLEAEEWVLDPAASSLELPDGATATLAVDGGLASGVGPCNSYTGAFVLDGTSVEIGPLAGTLIACEQALMDAQDAFVSALEAADTVELDGDRLLLTGPDDVRLAFDAVDRYQALVGEWDVVNLATADAVTGPVAGTAPTVAFADDGTVSATTGCNQAGGEWQLEGNALAIGPLAATFRTCDSPDGIMDQEAALFQALEDTAQMSVAGDTLTLLRADGTITLVLAEAG
ncbi:MAG: META domain-containing protein [Acidimicrobiales bacterium]|nr:META domain-containing protein [Acidimicrobiales bacterium]